MKEKIFVIPSNSSKQILEDLETARFNLVELLKEIMKENVASLKITVQQPIFRDYFKNGNNISKIVLPPIGTGATFREDLNHSILDGFPLFKIRVDFGGSNKFVFSEGDCFVEYFFSRSGMKNVLKLEKSKYVINNVSEENYHQLKFLTAEVIKAVACMIFRVGLVKTKRIQAWNNFYADVC